LDFGPNDVRILGGGKMQGETRLTVVGAALLLVAGFVITAPVSAASQYQVLYTFTGGKDGAISWAGLTFDAAGSLYGTTIAGGAYGYGSVFKLAPGAGGTWTESVLHSFLPHGLDGNQPEAGLIFDRAGNLYGTTYVGGAHFSGTVFKLAPSTNGTWTETILHSFTGGKDGGNPASSLIFDAEGNLYGTTFGAPRHCGVVFKLAPRANGKWTETVLHDFGPIKNGPNGGCQPNASLVFDSSGNIYGTTSTGGAHIYFGTVFKLTPSSNGKWTKTVLHSFSSKNGDGAYPYDNLILDAAGNLYGTAYFGGTHGAGTVFELTPGTNGKWAETVLHAFTGGIDGDDPYAGLTLDAVGDLYGTTNFGGSQSSFGVVFKLTPGANGRWAETVLHSFNGNDGWAPFGNVILDAAGNLYGTTLNGGDYNQNCPSGCGVVFKVTKVTP
jgi:uncharacterized repeat protein (TIGR03803 family)